MPDYGGQKGAFFPYSQQKGRNVEECFRLPAFIGSSLLISIIGIIASRQTNDLMFTHMAILAITLYSSASAQYQAQFIAIFDGSKKVPGFRVFPLDIDNDKAG